MSRKEQEWGIATLMEYEGVRYETLEHVLISYINKPTQERQW